MIELVRVVDGVIDGVVVPERVLVKVFVFEALGTAPIEDVDVLDKDCLGDQEIDAVTVQEEVVEI